MEGFVYTVYPGVFNPRSYISNRLFAKFILNMKDLHGKYILDMGCGSGIVSVTAVSINARCLAADINLDSVRCTKDNIKQNFPGDSTEVIQSDLFENIPKSEKFDIIFFNPPYYPREPETAFELAFNAGKNYRVIRDFVQEAGKFLKADGRICYIVSSDMDIALFSQILKEHRFKYEIVTEIYKFFETFYIVNSFLTSVIS